MARIVYAHTTKRTETESQRFATSVQDGVQQVLASHGAKLILPEDNIDAGYGFDHGDATFYMLPGGAAVVGGQWEWAPGAIARSRGERHRGRGYKVEVHVDLLFADSHCGDEKDVADALGIYFKRRRMEITETPVTGHEIARPRRRRGRD